jgi:hypothetical protein
LKRIPIIRVCIDEAANSGRAIAGARAMAKMCPLDGCRAKHGLCIHDKLMIVMALMGVALGAAHWGLNLI